MMVTEIAGALRGDILAGRLVPGEELHQALLADRFGVSRMPIRDALTQLAAQKLVELRPNRSAQVVQLTAVELRQLFDLRILIESDCLSRAVPLIDAADLDAIELEARRCEVEASSTNFPVADWKFHRSIYDCAHRPAQVDIIGELRMQCRMHISVYPSLKVFGDKWSSDHRQIVEAIARQSPEEAVEVLRKHIDESAQTLLAAMEDEK